MFHDAHRMMIDQIIMRPAGSGIPAIGTGVSSVLTSA